MSKNKVYKVFDCLSQSNTKDLEIHDNIILKTEHFPVENRRSKWCDFKPSRNVKINFDDAIFVNSSMNDLSISEMDHAFNSARMALMDSSSKKTDKCTWRQNLCGELMTFRDMFTKFPSTDVERYSRTVNSYMKLLSSIRLLLGYISDILQKILHRTLPSEIFNEPWYSLFHLHLDLRWYCLTCIYKLECCHLDGALRNELCLTYRSGESLIAYHVTLLASELFQLSILKFESVSLHDLSRTNPFYCKCVKELWFMLKVFVSEAGKKHTAIQPFRSIIKTLLNITLSEKREDDDPSESPDVNCTDLPVPERYVCSNPVAFCLWFFTHITQLRGYTDTGKYVGPDSNRMMTDLSELIDIIKVCMSPKNSVTEEQLRVYLPLVIELLCEWSEPDSEPVKIFWEYFPSRLNSGFFMRGTLPQNLMTSRDSGIEMLRLIESQLNGMSLHSNSFGLFLRLLGAHLQHCVRENKLKPWLQLKGRIYSKFSQSKMKSLTEMGLHHFTCLFLTLAIRIDLKEVTRRCQEFLSLLQMEDLDLPKKSAVWKAHLAFIQLHIDKGEDFTDVAQPLMKEVQLNSDNMRLMKIFVTDLETIFRQQNQLQEQPYHVLFDNWMLPYLSHANEYDSRQVLSMVLSLIPNLPKTKSSRLLLQHLLSFAKAQYGNFTVKPKKEVSDIAAEISFLAIKDPALCSETFTELYKYFGCSSVVNPESSCCYIIALFNREDMIDHIKVHIAEYQQLLIQSWIRFHLLLVNSDDLLTKMTEILENLPDVKYLSDLSGSYLIEEEEDNSFINFSRMLGEAYEELDEPLKQVSLREKCSTYFGQVVKIIDPVLKNLHSSQEHIERIYSCVFYLVSNCGALLYMKNKGNCVLPTLITHLFLPAPAEREFQPTRLLVIKKYLHRFIFCLEKLNSPGDTYISSVVKQMTVKYLPLFDINEKHPLYPCFICDAKEHILQAVSDNFLRCKGVPLNKHAETAIQFLLQLLRHHVTDSEIVLLVINVCLSRLFEMAVFVPETNKKQVKMSYLVTQELLKQCGDDETRGQFCSILSEFVKQNLAFTGTPLHKLLLFIANVHPVVMDIYLPKLWEEVKHVESRRGVAYDGALRTAMKAIETELQRRLNPERQ